VELTNKDLNLLLVFSTIWEERNLSKAAERLFVSQSAVSHSLKKLREEFGDPLFVRGTKGVAPTDFAQALGPKVRDLLVGVEGLYSSSARFDPKTAKRDLVLAVGDYFSIAMLEKFAARLEKAAPHVRLFLRPVANVFGLDAFEKGEIHLAITAIDVVAKEGFHSQELRQDRIFTCVRKGHPEAGRQMTKEIYLKAKHVNASNFGSDQGVVDELLGAIRKKREVKVVTSSFFDAARLVRRSDLVLSAPHQICLGLAREYDLTIHPLPFEFHMRSISMIWHERTNVDPFHGWIRGTIASL
jgi:DNA-binding transcriptional LysR family regulator